MLAVSSPLYSCIDFDNIKINSILLLFDSNKEGDWMKQVDISGAFSFAFQTLKKYPMLLLGPPIFFSFLSNLLNMFIKKFTPILAESNDPKIFEAFIEKIFGKIELSHLTIIIVILAVIVLLIVIISIIIGITLEIGRIRIAIHSFNKSEEDLTWNVYNNFGQGIIGKYFLTSLLLGLFILVGFIFLIIPAFIVALMFQFTLFILVEKKVKIIDSFKISYKLTNGIKWQLFGYGLLIFFIAIIIMIPIALLENFKLIYIYLPLNTIVTPIVSMYFAMAMLYIYKDVSDQEENLDRLIAESDDPVPPLPVEMLTHKE